MKLLSLCFALVLAALATADTDAVADSLVDRAATVNAGLDLCPTHVGPLCQFGCNCVKVSVKTEAIVQGLNLLTAITYNVSLDVDCVIDQVNYLAFSIVGLPVLPLTTNLHVSAIGSYAVELLDGILGIGINNDVGFDCVKFSPRNGGLRPGKWDTFTIYALGLLPTDHIFKLRVKSDLVDELLSIVEPQFCPESCVSPLLGDCFNFNVNLRVNVSTNLGYTTTKVSLKVSNKCSLPLIHVAVGISGLAVLSPSSGSSYGGNCGCANWQASQVTNSNGNPAYPHLKFRSVLNILGGLLGGGSETFSFVINGTLPVGYKFKLQFYAGLLLVTKLVNYEYMPGEDCTYNPPSTTGVATTAALTSGAPTPLTTSRPTPLSTSWPAQITSGVITSGAITSGVPTLPPSPPPPSIATTAAAVATTASAAVATTASAAATTGAPSQNCLDFVGFYEPPLQICPARRAAVAELAIDWANYDVISFDSFVANTGDTEGRVAVKNNFAAGNGFSVAALIYDNAEVSSLVVGGNITWLSGSLHPDQAIILGSPATIFSGADYFEQDLLRRSGITGALEAVKLCYVDQMNAFATSLANTVAGLQPNTGGEMHVYCEDAAESRYTIRVSVGDFNQITYYTLHGCNLAADYVIAIETPSNEPLVFGGAPFPQVGGVIYVLGDSRPIFVNVEVNGAILAPFSSLTMNGGVIKGKVVVGDAKKIVQVNRPCV